jgi:hypothetical protein
VEPAVDMLNTQRSELGLYADAPPPHGWRMVDGDTDGGSATEILGLGCVHVSTRKAGAASSRRYALSPLSSVRPCRLVVVSHWPHLSKRCIHLIIRVTFVCVAALCLFGTVAHWSHASKSPCDNSTRPSAACRGRT